MLIKLKHLKSINPPSSVLSLRSYKAAATGYYGLKPRPDPTVVKTSDKDYDETCTKTAMLHRIVQAYRENGFQSSKIDPLNIRRVDDMKKFIGDLSTVPEQELFNIEGALNIPVTKAVNFKQVLQILEEKYCGYVSFELGHLYDSPEKEWCHQVAEDPSFYHASNEEKKLICGHLLRAQLMENFLAKKFPSLKRYSGEGAESMLAFFHELFAGCMLSQVEELLISIPHRGRISLLTGMLNYPPSVLFHKIKGNPEFEQKYNFVGDVISHLTSSTNLKYGEDSLHVTMVPNPSHLEASHPVVYGKTRGRQLSKKYGHYGELEDIHKVMNIQVHGDAAVAAQGIVMETLLLESLPNFDVGGSVHLIVNNQVGFTTPRDRATSASHCSDIAKLINCPIIHVNGDHPDEVARAARIAFEYKKKFSKDIFVNMHCFRRWGHNELDDPTLTNPGMYKVIHSRQSVPDEYKAKLVADGVISADEVSQMESDYSNLLDMEFKNSGTVATGWKPFEGYWEGMSQAVTDTTSIWDTGVELSILQQVGEKSVEVPPAMTIHPHLVKTLCQARCSKVLEGSKIDWATAEAMAIGSLLLEGNNVRICGQDVGRATFNHRHAMLVDQESEEIFIPMNSIIPDQTGFLEVANSPLSEEAVLGFEYGMSIENPKHLCIWEAQFGDFFNGAQIIIDTFVSNGELKWLLQSGLVMLLPHGMDGAGPDHSSCKIERFLQLSDSKEDAVDGDNVNMEIVNPTTPAQYFHLLRRQLVRNYRKPLIVAAPKLILRMSAATSSLSEMTEGTYYKPVIGDTHVIPHKASTVVFCSGKYYYELDRLREKNGHDDMAIVRLESLVPFPAEELKSELKKYPAAEKFLWCQEEHRNQGPWGFIYPRFENLLNLRLSYVGRAVLGASAVGVTKWHAQESEDILRQLFG